MFCISFSVLPYIAITTVKNVEKQVIVLLALSLFPLSNVIPLSNANDVLLFFREKLKMKEREEAWVKIENLAKANPQVLKRVT